VKSQLLSGKYPELSKLYLRPDGTLKMPGDVVEQPVLAETLAQVRLIKL
jgi:gamma-glutamyltranspeptidase